MQCVVGFKAQPWASTSTSTSSHNWHHRQSTRSAERSHAHYMAWSGGTMATLASPPWCWAGPTSDLLTANTSSSPDEFLAFLCYPSSKAACITLRQQTVCAGPAVPHYPVLATIHFTPSETDTPWPVLLLIPTNLSVILVQKFEKMKKCPKIHFLSKKSKFWGHFSFFNF